MNPGPLYRLWERKASRDLQSESLDSEDSQINRGNPNYLDPWIVNLLLEYKEPEIRKDGQIGHVLRASNDAYALNHNEQCPAAVLFIGDGHHYIQTIIAAESSQMPVCDAPQFGFSSLVGCFIILQNYRICFKEASKMEDCEFYIILDCFQVMPLNRQTTTQHNCNQEPSVLQKIKELWQKRRVLQPWVSSESSSVSEVLKEIKEDQLSTLKQNVKDCLSIFNPGNTLDFEQLAIYPETKWQARCKQDKMCRDIFMAPAKLLAISAESKEALRKSCSPKLSQVPVTGDNTQDEDCSTISFFSAESKHLDDSFENPWDILPGMTLNSSSDNSGTPPGLPMTQQMLLASTAEKDASCSSSCTPDFLEPCAHVFHCNSEPTEPVVTASPTFLLFHNMTGLKKSVSQESGAQHIHIADSNMVNTVESVPCGQPLKNSCFHITMSAPSSAHPPSGNDVFLGPFCENTEGNQTASLQRSQIMMRRTGGKILETGRKGVAVKRKQMMADHYKPSETFLISDCSRQKALEQPSATISPQSNKLGKLPAWKPPLTFASTPKKSRIEEIHVQQHRGWSQLRCSERLLAKGREQGAAEGETRSLEQQLGIQQKECMRGLFFNPTYKSPTPELCAQVRSTRISRALLEWARWVFNNMQN